MSVINQSLANLQKRQQPQSVSTTIRQAITKQTPALPYIITTVCFIAVAIIGYYNPMVKQAWFAPELPTALSPALDVVQTAQSPQNLEPSPSQKPAQDLVVATPPQDSLPEGSLPQDQLPEALNDNATQSQGSMQVSAAQGKSRQITNLMESARLALQRQDLPAAVRFLSELQESKPQHMQSRMLLARLYYQNNEANMALTTLLHKVEAVTYTTDYLDFRATLFNEAKDYQRAIKDYERLARLEPNNTKWLLGSAIAYDKLNAHEDAYLAYSRIKEKGNLPKNIDTFIGQRLAVLKDLI